MNNCLILGSGRSGTSMVAGTLAKAGYFMGDNLYPAKISNPKGFFEDPEINGINEDLLSQVLPKRPPIIGKWFFHNRPRLGHYWLVRIPVNMSIPITSNITKRIQRLTKRQPFCLKDPRFCYTLPLWRPYLENTIYICVFRDPSSTVLSILKECKMADYLKDFNITYEDALEIWRLMYLHIIEHFRHQGDWLFLHYDQVLYGDGLERLRAITGAPVDESFPDRSLHRTNPSKIPLPIEIQNIYKQLCDLSEYSLTYAK